MSSYPPTPTSTTSSPETPPAAGPSITSVRLESGEGSAQVQGALEVAAAGQGGQAIITVFAAGSALGQGRGRQTVSLGQARLCDLRPGTVVFKLTLRSVARRALMARGQLDVTVRIVVAAPGMESLELSRPLVLR